MILLKKLYQSFKKLRDHGEKKRCCLDISTAGTNRITCISKDFSKFVMSETTKLTTKPYTGFSSFKIVTDE